MHDGHLLKPVSRREAALPHSRYFFFVQRYVGWRLLGSLINFIVKVSLRMEAAASLLNSCRASNLHNVARDECKMFAASRAYEHRLCSIGPALFLLLQNGSGVAQNLTGTFFRLHPPLGCREGREPRRPPPLVNGGVRRRLNWFTKCRRIERTPFPGAVGCPCCRQGPFIFPCSDFRSSRTWDEIPRRSALQAP